MKIIIGTSTPFHLVQLARELSEKGHNVTIIGYMPKYKMRQYNLGSAKYKSIFWELFPLSILALQRILPKIQSKITFLMMPFVDKKIEKYLSKCDVFIGLSGVVVNSFRYAKKNGAITICERGSAHVEIQNKLISRGDLQQLPRQYIDRELKGYELCDFISVPSIFSAKSFYAKGFPEFRIFINNYGVDLRRFNYFPKKTSIKECENKINALFVGAWSYQKGVDIISGALSVHKDLYVTHVGINAGVKFPASDRFTSVGHVANEKLFKYYNESDLLLLPSRQDGFGMVILESLACGTPVVASRNTGAPDVRSAIERSECIELLESISVASIIKAINAIMTLKCNNSSILSICDEDIYSWRSYGERYDFFIKEAVKD